MAKVLGLKQLLQKKYRYLEGLPDEILHSFGKLVENFTMIIWGNSGNGKSNFTMQFLKALMPHGKVLYIALEEGFEATTQMNALRQLDEGEHAGKIEFADHEMTIDILREKLKKKKSPKFVVVDSLQYWNITFEQYKEFKEEFINRKKSPKTLIFISHAKGKEPDGSTAQRIRYDAGIKVRIEKYIAFPDSSRYGGNNPYVIWEEGAKLKWGKNYKKAIQGLPSEKERKSTPKKPKHEKTPLPENKPLEEPQQLVLGEQPVQREGETILPELAQQSA